MKNPVKTLTSKIAKDVKETIKEEAGKTTEEIKTEVLETTTDLMPYLVVGSLLLVGICLARKPAPITVKVVLKQ